MKLPVQVRPLIIPKDIHQYWYDYGRCKLCLLDIRHDLHLYNHYRKYHWLYRTIIRYFVWYDMLQQWVEISKKSYISFKRMHQRPTAIARDQIVNNKQRSQNNETNIIHN